MKQLNIGSFHAHLFVQPSQIAEIVSFGVHLSMYLTVGKERHMSPDARCRKKISSLPPSGHTALFGLKTLPKNHPPVTRQNIADSCTQPEGAARHQSTPLHQQRNHVSLARMRGLHIRKKPPITPVFVTVVQNMHQASQTPAH